MKMKYQRLGLEEFGRELILTKDLDPIYIALNGAGFPEEQKLRWLCAYSAFYHAGVASWISEMEGPSFWSYMTVAAANSLKPPTGQSKWPRGKERRHWRGEQCLLATQDWQRRYPEEPEQMYRYIAGGGGLLSEVIARAREHLGVGAWMAFKAADLVDACCGVDVEQSETELFLYETPRKSLLNFWRSLRRISPDWEIQDEGLALKEALEVTKHFWVDLEIPHKPGRPVDWFVRETCYCKHLSHMNGSYPVGEDILDITQGLETWAFSSKAAEQFLGAMPAYRVPELCPTI